MTSFIRQVSECPCAFPFDFLVFDHWKFIDVDVLLFIFCRSRSRSPRHRRSGGGHRRRSPDSRSPSPRSKYFSLMMQQNRNCYSILDHRRVEREKPSRRDEPRRRRHSSSEDDRSPKRDNEYTTFLFIRRSQRRFFHLENQRHVVQVKNEIDQQHRTVIIIRKIPTKNVRSK